MPLLSPSPWRRSQVAVLTFLLTACGIMTTVAIRQDQTIHEQRELIMRLYQDSHRLADIQMKEAAKAIMDRQQKSATP